MFFSILMLGIAVMLIKPVLTGKGKLMSTENIKKEKINTYIKWLRILYGILLCIALIMTFTNFVEKVAYVQTHYYEFTEDYMGADGILHTAGESHPTNEMREILIPTESNGSMCAPASTEALPYKYSGTTYKLQDSFSFMSFISYQAAHILSFVALGIAMAVIVVLFIFINRMTDKEVQKKSNSRSKGPVRPSMPKGAFDFSDYKDEVEVDSDMFDDVPQEIPSKKK